MDSSMNQELFHTHSACDKVLLSSASDICYPSLVLPISWSILHKFCQTCLSPHPGCARGAGRSKLFAKLLKSVGRGKSSYKEARDISEAAISDGASSTDLLSAIRPSDRNVSRDVYRKFRIDHCMWLQLYEADIFVRRPGKGIVENRWGVLLPHELFSCLACDFPDVWEELFCVPPDYFDRVARAADPWFNEHLLKDKVLDTPHQATPIRLFCDDTGLRKTRNVRILHWFGEGSSTPTWRRKIPCYILPMHLLVGDLTEGPLQEIVQWSFNALALGKWPMLDHTGQPWSSKTSSGLSAYRAKKQGSLSHRIIASEFTRRFQLIGKDTKRISSGSRIGRRTSAASVASRPRQELQLLLHLFHSLSVRIKTTWAALPQGAHP